jgi:predicted phosphodiesterase
MKIAAISDIHGNLAALQAVLADIDRAGVDHIINCGDTLGGPLESAKTADLLISRKILMIAGNHERQLLTLPPEKLNRSDACTASEINPTQRAWLASAPPTLWLTDDVFICHGTPSSDLQYWMETVTTDFGEQGSVGVRPATQAEIIARLETGEHEQRASLIVCGHTHIPRVAQVRSADNQRAITIVNPGSIGLQGYAGTEPHKHWMETGSPHARYALIESSAHSEPIGWHVQLRNVSYDVEPMALLAEERGRLDWARPLRTGRMG